MFNAKRYHALLSSVLLGMVFGLIKAFSATGPTPVKHMANAGLVIDGIFGQANNRIGLGYTWSDPADRALDDQSTIDAYDRVQLTPEIQVGPTLQVIFDPVRNLKEDMVYVWGIRFRIAL